MIGGAFQRLRHAGMVAAIAAGLSALPDLGQQRTLTSRPGSGLVRSTGRPKPRRDAARQAAAQAKRERKNAKRLRDSLRQQRRRGGIIFTGCTFSNFGPGVCSGK